MGAETEISWAHSTFNMVIGCEKVVRLNARTGKPEISPACLHCYAERDTARTQFQGAWGKTAKRYTLSDTYWQQPLKWEREAAAKGERRRVFCSSWGDVFEDHPVVEQERKRLWPLIEKTTHLDWLLLSKRMERMRSAVPWDFDSPWPNVWLGTTAEDQQAWDERVDVLRTIPARVHFVSVEPMLGPLTFRPRCDSLEDKIHALEHGYANKPMELLGIDWVICGGESGGQARPTKLEWVRSLRDQCVAAGAAFHFKQWGEHDATGVRVGRKQAGRVLDGKVWDEVPQAAAISA